MNTTRMLLEDKDHVFPALCLQIPSKAPGGNEYSVNVGQINGGSLASEADVPLAPLKAWGQVDTCCALLR